MIALFPGKFQPPHLGHILTLLKLYDDYDKIIVGICELEDCNLIDRENIKDIFKQIFKYMPKYEIRLLKGSFKYETVFDNLYGDFDVIITGNKSTIELLERHNIECRYIDRTFDKLYNGSDLRRLYEYRLRSI